MSDVKKPRKKRVQGANLTQVTVKKLLEYVGEDGLVPVSSKWLKGVVTEYALKALSTETEQVIEEQKEEQEAAEHAEARTLISEGVKEFKFPAPTK